MVSTAYQDGFYYRPRIDWELLKENNEGLIALTACLGGEIPSLISNGLIEQAFIRAKEISKIFDNNRLYLELQENFIPEQQIVNQGLIEIGKEIGLPIVATNDCHYLTREDAFAHEVLLCIQTGKTMDDSDRMRFPNDEFYVKTPDEMSELFKSLPEAIQNSVEVAERCNLDLDVSGKKYHFPSLSLAKEQTASKALEEQSFSGLDSRVEEIRKIRPEFSEKDYAEYQSRLGQELKIINQMGFPGYFLIVADFINWAKDHHIPVGPGRGSAAGSLVAYALKITDIDPMPYQLLFERFLNPERVSMPDIDVDFCINGREDVIAYVREKFGKDNVAQIITFGSMLARAVIRDVGRGMGMSYGEVDTIAKLVPNPVGKKITLKEALKQEPRLRELVDKDARVKKLFDVALSLEGLTRHASTHAAGVVITPEPLTNYLPLYVDPKSQSQVTQYDMGFVEKIGLVKFDFLGLKTLTVIDKTVRLIKQKKSQFDLKLIPHDDHETFQLLSRGETTGVFQLESSGMKEYLIKLKPSCFEDMIAMVALYRPGPLGSGMVDSFIKRKHGIENFTYDFPQLEAILKDTYGVIVYQEQVMQIAQILGNYTLGGADLLRRAMGKKKPEEMAKQKKIFLDGAKSNKLDAKKAEQVFDQMEKFAEYGFNKSHSAAYAFIAYQTAYLKAHFPVEFMAALLTEDMENTEKVIKNINEIRTMGIEILPPDINASNHHFTVYESDIGFGLGAVKGVGEGAVENIVETRTSGEFVSLYDFCERVDLRRVNKRVIEALIKCGSFDSLGFKRAQLMAVLEQCIESAQKVQKERETGQESLFGNEEIIRQGGQSYGQLPNVEEWPENLLLSNEKESIGFYITGHPLARHSDAIKRFSTSDTAGLKERADKEDVVICGIVTGVKLFNTRKGERMAFVTLEDLSGFVEMLVFPETYTESAEILNSEEALLVKGNLDVGEDSCKIIVSEVHLLNDFQTRMTKKIHFRLTTPGLDEAQLHSLKGILGRYHGQCEALIHLIVPNRSETVISLPEKLKLQASDQLIDDVEKLFGYNVVTFE